MATQHPCVHSFPRYILSKWLGWVPIWKRAESWFIPSTKWEHREKRAISEPRCPYQTWFWTFQPQTVRNKYMLLINHPVWYFVIMAQMDRDRICLMSPQDQFQVMHLWLEDHSNAAALFSLHSGRWGTISLWPITRDVNFDHLSKGMYARLFHGQVLLFSLCNE